jgi:hypothetical protein
MQGCLVGVVRCEMNLRLVWGGRKKVVRWQLDCVGVLLLIVEEINGERVYIYTGSKTLIAEFRCNMNRYR